MYVCMCEPNTNTSTNYMLTSSRSLQNDFQNVWYGICSISVSCIWCLFRIYFDKELWYLWWVLLRFLSFYSYIRPPSLYLPVLLLCDPLPHMGFQSPLPLLFHNSNCVLFKHLSVQRNENKTTVQKITEFTPAQKTQWHATNSWTQSTREIDSASRIWEKKT